MWWNYWGSKSEEDRCAAHCLGVAYNYPHEDLLVLSHGQVRKGAKWKIKAWETFLRRFHSLPKERFKSPWFDHMPHPEIVSEYGGAIMPRVYR